MEATELIELIRTSEKKTPVRVVLQANAPCEFPGAEVFSGGNGLHILYGDWKTLGPQLTAQAAHIDRLHVENGACNSAIPMLDLKGLHARVEPGAIIREGAQIGENAVVMMGAILNLGAVVGEGSMIDMGAVLGGRATVGKNCHIGAGAVLAGRPAPRRSSWRMACSSARMPSCSRASISAKMPSSRPEPSSRRTCRRMPSWRARPPAC